MFGSGNGNGLCTVKAGAHSQQFAAGQPVSALRASMALMTTISADAVAFVGNRQVDGEYIVSEGEVVTFSRPTGEKG